MVRERSAFFIQQWTSAERHLAGGTHPSSLATDLALRAELAWFGPIWRAQEL